MPTELKQNFIGGLDLDTSYYELARNKYVDALNITRDGIKEAKDVSITNIPGNTQWSSTIPNGKIIGRVSNQLRNTEIFFKVADNNVSGSILEWDKSTGITTVLFEDGADSATDILGFNPDGKVVNANIYNRSEGDLLFFLNSVGEPLYINIERFRNKEYNPVTKDIITVIKRPPLSPPYATYDNDTTRRANNLRKKFFKFQYLWQYDDFEESTLGPESAMPIPTNVNDDEYTNEITNNNVIRLSMNSGPKNVKRIILLMAVAEASNTFNDYVVVDTIDKEELAISDDGVFNFNFYNDSTYPLYEVARRIQLYDYVPTSAISQEMPNGNVVCYAGISEGLDRALTPDVEITVLTTPAGDGGSTGSLSASVSKIQVHPFNIVEYFLKFVGVPATGTVVNVKLRRLSDSAILTVGTYTTLAGDTEYDVRVGLRTSMNTINIVQDVDLNGDGSIDFEFSSTQYAYSTTEIVAPGGSSADNSIATWPFSTERRLGIAYFDLNGVTNGILYDAQVTFPAYAEDGSQAVLLPYINVKINHIPPIWAYSYQILVTKEPTQFVYWYTSDVNTAETDFTYFDVTNMYLNATKNPTTNAVLNWTFQDGDRMRLIRNATDDTVFADTYDAGILGILFEPTIATVVQTGKTFIKIKNVPPFTGTDYTTNEFVIQLYRPGLQEANDDVITYYELGVQNPIIDPGEVLRYHGGSVTNQDAVTPAETNIFNGDTYFRVRTVNVSETGLATYNVQDKNVVDFFTSQVSSVSGRPNIIDENLKPTTFSAMIRYGQEYQANTNINGLNRFPALSFMDCDYSQGPIQRMKVRNRAMRIFQFYKVGVIPLFSQINKQPSGGNLAVTTDHLLNPVQYYEGNNGIGDAKESLASYNEADYFCDTVRGMICRISGNGVTQISVLAKVNSWATENIPLRTGTSHIYGTYDPRTNNYIVALEESLLADSLAIGFQGIVNFSGIYLTSPSLVGACLGTSTTLYYVEEFAVGVILYTTDSLTTPLTGISYIVDSSNQIYSVDPATGEVLALVTDGVCFIGEGRTFRIGNSTGTVCSATFVILYTDGTFGIGKVMYYDSALQVPVTGFTYIVDVNDGGNIYNLNTVTGVVGSDTTLDCNAGIAALYKVGTTEGTICSETEVTLYTLLPFAVGVVMYSDSSCTTILTGKDFIVDSAGNIYVLGSLDGVVGALTGGTCPIAGDGLFTIENNTVGVDTIDNVTPLIIYGYNPAFQDYPIGPGQAIIGTQVGFTAALSVDVTVTAGPYTLTLFRSGISLQTLPVVATGTFAFSSITATAAQPILITLT